MRENKINNCTLHKIGQAISILILLSISTQYSMAQGLMERRNAIKITFLSWFTGTTKISFERSVAQNQSGELTFGLICAGFDKYKNHPRGYTLRYAHKFILKNDTKFALNGFYVKPELVWSNFNYDKKGDDGRTKANMLALFGCSGYQWAKKHFLVDGYIGCGPAFGTPADTYYHHGFILWNYFNSYCKHIAMTFAVKLGYSF